MTGKETKKSSEVKQLVTFELQDSVFGMDIMIAQENLKFENIRPVPNSPYYFEGFKNLRGEIIPVINFKKLFSFSKFDMEKDKYIIRIEIDNAQFGIVVDKVLRVVSYKEEEIKAVTDKDKDISNYIYGVIENEGDLISILNMKAIFNYTDKTLLIGTNDDYYVLKHRRDKTIFTNFNKESNFAIKKFANRINFPINDITEIAVKKFISRILTEKELNLNTALNYIEREVKDSETYTNFNYKGKRILFDLDDDYKALQKIITNILVPGKTKNNDKSLKIWNIGCDNGLESYSIAFLIKNYIEDYFTWNIEITCTGEDYTQLTKAKKGTYPKSDFSRFYVKNFEEFLKTSEDEEKEIKNLEEFGDEVSIIDEIKNMIKFDMRNILNMNKSVSGEYDLIFCRNILTDLSDKNINNMLESFSNSLKKEGLLVLSEIESIESYTLDFIQKEVLNRSYYIKQ